MTELAKYVKQMRKQYGLTQVELSQKSGVGLRFVREVEQGKETLRLDKVNQVLALFGAVMVPGKQVVSRNELRFDSLIPGRWRKGCEMLKMC